MTCGPIVTGKGSHKSQKGRRQREEANFILNYSCTLSASASATPGAEVGDNGDGKVTTKVDGQNDWENSKDGCLEKRTSVAVVSGQEATDNSVKNDQAKSPRLEASLDDFPQADIEQKNNVRGGCHVEEKSPDGGDTGQNGQQKQGGQRGQKKTEKMKFPKTSSEDPTENPLS